VDFISLARISGVWAEVRAPYITQSQVLSSSSGFGTGPCRAVKENYGHVIQFLCYDCQLIGLVSLLPSKTMANASGKRIGTLIIYSICLAHNILPFLSSEPK